MENLFLERLKLKIVSIGRLEFMVKPVKRIRVETSYIESIIRIASVLINRIILKNLFSLIGRFSTLLFSEGRR